jgi:hypothetical protein
MLPKIGDQFVLFPLLHLAFLTERIDLIIAAGGVFIGLIGVFTPWLYDLLDAYHFRKAKGRIIGGKYFSVFSNPAVVDREFPVTWETGVFKQHGRKVHYVCTDNDYEFQYEMCGHIYEDCVVGRWLSKLTNERVHGSSFLYITPRGNLVGIWAGDAKPNRQKTFGYWALSADKDILERFVQRMHKQAHFRMVDVLSYFNE